MLAARCLNTELFAVVLSDLSVWVEMDISLCDSRRSDCHTSPQTSLLHHAAMRAPLHWYKREDATRNWSVGLPFIQFLPLCHVSPLVCPSFFFSYSFGSYVLFFTPCLIFLFLHLTAASNSFPAFGSIPSKTCVSVHKLSPQSTSFCFMSARNTPLRATPHTSQLLTIKHTYLTVPGTSVRLMRCAGW